MVIARKLHCSRRRGFTVLELVIVLVVLAALAGLVIGMFPSLLTKTHVAVSTTNLRDLNQSMQRYSMLNQKQPSRFDSLVETGGTDPYAGLPFDTTALTYFTARVPTADEVDSLTSAGITEVVSGIEYDAATDNATFDYEDAIAPVSITNPLLFVTNLAHLQEVMNIEAGETPVGTYVIFGVGPRSTFVGNGEGGIAEAPIHFGENENANPAKAYSRYFVVYRVDSEKARFVGAIAAHDDGLASSNSHLAEMYEK